MISNLIIDAGVVLSAVIILVNFLLTLGLHFMWLRLNAKATLLQSKIEKLEVTKSQLKRIKQLEALVEPKPPKKKTPFEVFWHDNLYRLSSQKDD